MRNVATVFVVMGVVTLMAMSAFAGGQQITFDNGNGDPDVWGNASDTANWNSPTATTGGALWLQTGSGPPVQYPSSAGDLNMELWIDVPNGAGGFAWTRLTTLLLSATDYPSAGNNWVGAASGDMTAFGPNYPGFFLDNSGNGYEVPNTNDLSGPYSSYQVQFYVWAGPYNTFTAAAAAGEPVAYTGAFTQPVPFGEPPPIPGDVDAMPATILRTQLPGDANLDGKVDINDLTIVLAHYNQTGMTWIQGEFTGDGTVDINDLTIVLAHYNQSLASSAGSLASVPEPSTAVLLVALLMGAVLSLRRRPR